MRESARKLEEARKKRKALKCQKTWATDLQKRAGSLKGLVATLPNRKTEIQRIRTDVEAKQSWLTLPVPAENAERHYLRLVDEIRKLQAEGLFVRSRASHPPHPRDVTVSVIDLQSSAEGTTKYIQMRVSEEAAAREERFKRAREAKVARRAHLQRAHVMFEKEVLDDAANIAEQVGVNLVFARGAKGTKKPRNRGKGKTCGAEAARLFLAHGDSSLTDPTEIAAAHMLSVFSYSHGTEQLLDHLGELGLSSRGLNLEHLKATSRWSIRVNNQYRICFNWDKETKQWTDVWYGDYH